MLTKNQFMTCIPLVSDNEADLYKEIEAAIAQKPDYLEWRRDYFLEDDLDIERRILRKMHTLDQGLIYTFRSVDEGGFRHVTEKERCKHIVNCIRSGAADYVDIELDGDASVFEEVKKTLKKERTQLMLSHHNFEKTYGYNEIRDIFEMMEAAGADVLKMALNAVNETDFRTILAAGSTHSLKTNKPMVVIAMGESGRLSRVLPELLGGGLTFAAGAEHTAPGQLSLLEILEKRRGIGI